MLLMRIALLGAGGQLGQELLRTLPGSVLAVHRSTLDLAQRAAIAPALDALRPSVIVNCAAYNLVDQAEVEPQHAKAVNALAVGELARWCGEHGCPLVHFSTDQ